MRYVINKVLVKTRREIGATAFTFNGNKLFILNGFIYAYIDVGNTKDILKLGRDGNILMKHILNDTYYGGNLPIIANNAIYHIINNNKKLPTILKDDMNLNRIKIFEINDLDRIYNISIINDYIYILGNTDNTTVLCKLTENGGLQWKYPIDDNTIISPLTNDKVIATINNNNNYSYIVINNNGELEHNYLICNNAYYTKIYNPIIDNTSAMTLLCTLIHKENHKDTLTRVCIIDASGIECCRQDINAIIQVFCFYNQKYIVYKTGNMHINDIYLYNMLSNRNIANTIVPTKRLSLAFIKKIKKVDNNFIVIISGDGYFKFICLNMELIHIWNFDFQGNLVDADFEDGHIYFLTDNEIGIYQIDKV